MTRPHWHCAATPLSPSSSVFSCVSSSSASSSGSCYVPSCSPKQRNSKTKRSKRKKASNGAAAVAIPRRNSSIYRGVTRHRGTGKYEAHLWDRHAWSPAKNKKGRQVYLGAYNSEEDAARTYDLAALKYWGSECVLNFPLESYRQELEEMQRMTREAYLATLRRRSSCFSRGASEYRGVAKHHHNGRWEARIGHACGKKYLYLGTFGTQEEAARAYDLAALEFRGHRAITNFDLSSYTYKDYLQQPEPPVHEARPEPVLKPKDEPVPLPKAHPTPLLQPKTEPEPAEPVAPPPGPVLRDADDVDHAIAEILPALCMDPADFEARYPARRARALGWPADDLPLPGDVGFEDDIETLFDAPGSAAAPGEVQAQVPAAAAPGASRAGSADAVSCAAATISLLASGRWW